MISVRRLSPYLSRTSSSSLTMTARSFFSLPRISSYSAIFARISLEFFQEFVNGKLGEAIELQFEDGVDLAQGEAALFVALRARGRA